MRTCFLLPATCLLFAALAVPARAVDGVIEINDARAAAGGITPGDAPGYPVTIDQPGSYRLTGPLTSSDRNANVIEITEGSVELDLNGFTIRCLLATGPCIGSGRGVSAEDVPYVTVRNGTVQNMAGYGIILGNYAKVENVRSHSNGGHGILVGILSSVEGVQVAGNGADGINAAAASRVSNSLAFSNADEGIDTGSDCTVDGNRTSLNGSSGIDALGGSLIQNNTSSNNGSNGITAGASTVTNNTVSSNTGSGIAVTVPGTVIANTVTNNARCGLDFSGPAVGFGQNVLEGNNGADANLQANGGTQIGSNYCAGHPCGTGPANSCP